MDSQGSCSVFDHVVRAPEDPILGVFFSSLVSLRPLIHSLAADHDLSTCNLELFVWVASDLIWWDDAFSVLGACVLAIVQKSLFDLPPFFSPLVSVLCDSVLYWCNLLWLILTFFIVFYRLIWFWSYFSSTVMVYLGSFLDFDVCWNLTFLCAFLCFFFWFVSAFLERRW